jgi:hypothetical protein
MRKGHCLRGTIRYVAHGEVTNGTVCHCTM